MHTLQFPAQSVSLDLRRFFCKFFEVVNREDSNLQPTVSITAARNDQNLEFSCGFLISS
jgi:hypothetical protein